MFSPFLDEELADENVPRKAGDAVAELPYWGRIDGAELVRDFLNDVIEERLVDVADGGVICTPCIDGEAVLLGEVFFKEGHVGCVGRDVDHPLEANVLIRPDRPA